MKERRRHRLAILGLLMLPTILLFPCLFGQRTFVPWDIAQFPPTQTTMTAQEYASVTAFNNTDVTEIPVMFLPELRFIKSEIARGEMPGWNPYARSGTHLWASSILGVWYPLNWVVFLTDDPADALAFVAFLSIAIALLLMYGFLTHLGLSVPAALFGALAFGLSGTLTVNLHFYQRINALIWLPGILWAISAITGRKGRERIPGMLGLATCMFFCHTSGFPPFALAVTLIAVAFCVRSLAITAHRGVQPTVSLALALAGAALLGVLLASVQSVPMAEFFPESNRTMQAHGNSLASGGFDPAGLLGYLGPTTFTHPFINKTGQLSDQFSPLFWYLYSRGSWLPTEAIPAGTVFTPNLNFCEYTVFVGTPTLLLALLGLLTRGTCLRLFAAGALVMLFLLASATPLVSSLLEAPPFCWVPPSRYTGCACMFVALLAAHGLHQLPRIRAAVRNAVGGLAVVAGAAFLGMAFWFARNHDGTSFLQLLAPTILEKYGDRFPEITAAHLPEALARFLGPHSAMALAKFVANLRTSGVALLLSGLAFVLLPLAQRMRNGVPTLLGLLALLTVVELLRFGMPLNTGHVLWERPLNRTPVHAFLHEQRDAYSGRGGFTVLRVHDPHGTRRLVDMPKQLPPDLLLNDRIRDEQVYTFVDKWSHLPIYALYGPRQLTRNTWPNSVRDDEKLQNPFWDMIGVRFVLTEDLLRFAGKEVGPLLSGPPKPPQKTPSVFRIYERPHPLPRAWVVHDFARAPKISPERRQKEYFGVPATMDPDPETLALLDQAAAVVDPEFEPANVVILDDATISALGPSARREDRPGNQRLVTFPVRDETNTLTLDVAAGAAGYLVVNDTAMSGWTVTVDGQPAAIHRANLFQRMVVLPASAQTVRVHFSYRTPGFALGLSLSVLAGSVWLLLVFLGFSRRGEPGAENPS